MIAIIDCGSTKVPKIVEYVSEYSTCYSIEISSLPLKNTENLSGIIVSGAPILITENDPRTYVDKIKDLLNLNIPLLGICFGHQIIGLCFEAKAMKMQADRDFNTIEILNTDPLFKGFENSMEMMEDHCEHITLPENFIHLNSSKNCLNEGNIQAKQSMGYNIILNHQGKKERKLFKILLPFVGLGPCNKNQFGLVFY